ncbi:MAG: hypothetical protein IPM69_06525 [Ignavibacteria bacterium]|nr:hypothetical protein [Ignavibacteria bacterium]
MKTGRIFWGTFLLSSGIILLLGNYGMVNVYWEGVWKLWPLALIIWGAKAFIQDQTIRSVLSACGGILLGMALFSGIFTGVNTIKENINFDCDSPRSGKETSQVLTETFESTDSTVKAVNFELDAGAGKFFITGDSTQSLVEASTLSSFGGYDLETTRNDSSTTVELSMQDGHVHWNWFKRNKMENRVDIKLNTFPLWNLDVDLGASASNFDLTKYRVNKLSMDVGAASVKVKLGDRTDSTHFNLECGAASVELSIPTNSGCILEFEDDELSGTDLAGFEKISESTYRTANFEAATKKVFVNLSMGASKFKVIRH